MPLTITASTVPEACTQIVRYLQHLSAQERSKSYLTRDLQERDVHDALARWASLLALEIWNAGANRPKPEDEDEEEEPVEVVIAATHGDYT